MYIYCEYGLSRHNTDTEPDIWKWGTTSSGSYMMSNGTQAVAAAWDHIAVPIFSHMGVLVWDDGSAHVPPYSDPDHTYTNFASPPAWINGTWWMSDYGARRMVYSVGTPYGMWREGTRRGPRRGLSVQASTARVGRRG